MEETLKNHNNPDNANMVLGNVYFSRELFVETVEAIESQYRHDENCAKAFKVLLPSDYTSGYDNHFINNQLIKIIQVALNDSNMDNSQSWIEYFMFELDFGKKYEVGMVTNTDKSPIDLSDVGRLWDYLNVA